MIPLVVLDLDGTVIGSDGQVQPCVWQAVEKVREAGVKLAVCTGRPGLGVAQKVAQRLGPRNPHIFQNGALVSYPDGDIVHVAALREATSRELIELARDHGFVLELYTPTSLYIERKTPLAEAHAKMIGVSAIVSDLVSVVENEPVVRAQWVVPFDDEARVRALMGADLELSRATSPALKGTAFLSVTRRGVTKGSAVRQLSEALKVNLANVMGVGDSSGDIPMLDTVGHPVVMANADAELKARYDTVTGDVDECGVVAALEEALKLKPA